MNMKGKWKKITSFGLAAIMSVQMFTGCSKPSGTQQSSNSNNVESKAPLSEATSVEFNSEGKYKTTIKSNGVDFSNVKADDIQVVYHVVNQSGYRKAMSDANKNSKDAAMKEAFEKVLQSKDVEAESCVDEETGEVVDAINLDIEPEEVNVDISKYTDEKQAEVKKVTAEKDKLEISFSDPDAAENLTGYYDIEFKEDKLKDAGASVEVEFKEYTLTPNLKSVVSNDKDIKLTLELNDSTFTDDITKNDIELSGSFEKMKIESISSSGKNLTMQLTGKPVVPENMTTYTDGIVSIDPHAVKNAGNIVRATVPIELERMFLDSSSIKADGEKVTATVKLVGISEDIAGLKPEDFVFDRDVTVTKAEKKSNNEATLTMTVKGAKDANTAAAVLDGQKLRVLDKYEIDIMAEEASFYPVFDYVEKSGENLQLTLMLYSNDGTFADKLNKDQVVLGGDFTKGKVDSLEKETDTTAKLMITVPANGESVESFDMDGDITIKSGSLISEWGEATSADTTDTRNYSQESTGRTGEGDVIRIVINDFTRPVEPTFMNLIGRKITFNDLARLNMESSLNSRINRLTSLRNGILSYSFVDNPASEQAARAANNRVFSSVKWGLVARGLEIAASAVFLGYMVYDFCGNMGLCGPEKEMVSQLKETEQRVRLVEQAVVTLNDQVDKTLAMEYMGIVNRFYRQLEILNTKVDKFSKYYDEKFLKKLNVKAPAVFSEDLETQNEYVPGEEVTQYAIDVASELYQRSTDAKKGKNLMSNVDFIDYVQTYEELEETLLETLQILDPEEGISPIQAFDKTYEMTDNFDTTSYLKRVSFRNNVENEILRAMDYVRAYNMMNYTFETNDDGSVKTQVVDGEECYVFEGDGPDMVLEDELSGAEEKLWQNMNTYEIETVDLSKWKNPSFSKLESCSRIVDKKTESYTYPADSAYAKAWAKHEGYKEPVAVTVTYKTENDVVPYCYTLNTYVRKIDREYLDCTNNSVGVEMFKEQTNFTDQEIMSFYNKMQKETLLEELIAAGVYIEQSFVDADDAVNSGGSYGIAFNWYNSKNNVRSKVYYWDSKTYDQVTTDEGKNATNKCRTDVEVWHKKGSEFVDKPGVIYS